MNVPQFLALMRQIATFSGSFIVSHGYVTSSQYDVIVGAIIALIGVGLEMWSSRKVGLLNDTARLTEVQSVIVTKDSLAAKTESDKITT